MMVLDEMEYEEISKITGISNATLRVKIHRIKERLKKNDGSMSNELEDLKKSGRMPGKTVEQPKIAARGSLLKKPLPGKKAACIFIMEIL